MLGFKLLGSGAFGFRVSGSRSVSFLDYDLCIPDCSLLCLLYMLFVHKHEP